MLASDERSVAQWVSHEDALPLPNFTGTYADALRGIVDRDFCFSKKYREQQNRANREGAEKPLLEFERKLVKRMEKLGVPMFAHCVQRTDADQQLAFVTGRSKAQAGQSPHNWGCAVDVIHSTKAWGLTRAQWALVGHVGKELAAQLGIEVEWGGDWKFYDPAHWELAHWRDARSAGLLTRA